MEKRGPFCDSCHHTNREMTGHLNRDESEDERKVHNKSKQSIRHAFLRFKNMTQRRVDIVWLNYEGARVKYKTLLPDQCVDINTFAGHPWVFFDADTGDRLMVQLKEVFEANSWSSQEDWPPQRKVVNITIPVYSLQVCCLHTIQSLVPRSKVHELDLTEHLKVDLHRMYRNRTLHRQNALSGN